MYLLAEMHKMAVERSRSEMLTHFQVRWVAPASFATRQGSLSVLIFCCKHAGACVGGKECFETCGGVQEGGEGF